MLQSEFIARTGYAPQSAEEYRRIEVEYLDFSGDKDAFCERWVAELNFFFQNPEFPAIFDSIYVAVINLQSASYVD